MATRYLVPKWQFESDVDVTDYLEYTTKEEMLADYDDPAKLVYIALPARGDDKDDEDETVCLAHCLDKPDMVDVPQWYIDMTDATRGCMATGRLREFADWYLKCIHPHEDQPNREEVKAFKESIYEFGTQEADGLAILAAVTERRVVQGVTHGGWLDYVQDMREVVHTRVLLERAGRLHVAPDEDGCCMLCRYTKATLPDWMSTMIAYHHMSDRTAYCLAWALPHMHIPDSYELPEDVRRSLLPDKVADSMWDIMPAEYESNISAACYLVVHGMRRFGA